MNEQTRFHHFVLHRFNNFIERHHHGFKIRLVELQRKIRRSFQARHADALALQILRPHGLGGDDDRAVAFAEACAAIEQNIFIAQRRISGETHGGHVVGFRQRGFVQGLNVGKNVRVLVARRRQLVGRQRVKHERVVGIGRMSQLDLAGLFFGLGRHLSCSHGLGFL